MSSDNFSVVSDTSHKIERDEDSISLDVVSTNFSDNFLVISDNLSVKLKNQVHESDNVVALYNALSTQDRNDDEWYVDSGATKHMTNVDHDMKNIKEPSIKRVKAANGGEMEIKRTSETWC